MMRDAHTCEVHRPARVIIFVFIIYLNSLTAFLERRVLAVHTSHRRGSSGGCDRGRDGGCDGGRLLDSNFYSARRRGDDGVGHLIGRCRNCALLVLVTTPVIVRTFGAVQGGLGCFRTDVTWGHWELRQT
jgi:hypothetical protein